MKKGFSMIEVAVGIGLLSICMVFVIGLYLRIFTATQKGIEVTAGTVAANKIVDDLAYKYEISTHIEDTYKESGKENINGVEYTYNAYVENVQSGVAVELKKIDVEVIWWASTEERTAENKEEFFTTSKQDKIRKHNYGLTATKASRIIMIPGQ